MYGFNAFLRFSCKSYFITTTVYSVSDSVCPLHLFIVVCKQSSFVGFTHIYLLHYHCSFILCIFISAWQALKLALSQLSRPLLVVMPDLGGLVHKVHSLPPQEVLSLDKQVETKQECVRPLACHFIFILNMKGPWRSLHDRL